MQRAELDELLNQAWTEWYLSLPFRLRTLCSKDENPVRQVEVAPDGASRVDTVSYVRADIASLPLRSRSFDFVVSFQVIEHLVDPSDYLQAIGRLLKPEGTALITTPNLLTSDRENPFHVHEYGAAELEGVLQRHFDDTEMRGIGASPAVAAYVEARLERVRRIVRLDPLGLRRRLPRGLTEWLFGRFALLVRRGIQRDQGLPDATPADFPIGEADADCLDLLAICRAPRR